MQRPELEVFNRLRGDLEIELTEPTQQTAPHLLNRKAPPAASIKSVRLRMSVFEGTNRRPLTDSELASIAFDRPQIRLRGESGDEMAHEAPNGRYFTVRDLIAAVERTERETRADAEWLGGIDVHHTYFEGLEPADDGSWSICWGS